MLHGAARESRSTHPQPSADGTLESKARPARDALDPVAVAHEARAAEDAFVDLLRGICSVPHFDASSAERLSREIAGCFDGGRVNLLSIDVADLEALPPAAWQAMDNRAFELGAAGIERLSLPLSASTVRASNGPDNPLSTRLALLPHLTHLVLAPVEPVRHADETHRVPLNLQGLAACGLMSVQIKPAAGLCVLAGPLVKCTATERFDMRSSPCWVDQPNAGSQAGPVALAYEEPFRHAQPVGACVAPPIEVGLDRQSTHRCQIMRWLQKSGAYGTDAVKAAAALSSRPDGRSPALTAENMAAWQSMVKTRPDAVFDFRNLGVQLNDYFSETQLVAGKPPPHRWFFLDVGGSALGLGLQACLENGRPKLQIQVCDPSEGKSRVVSFDARKDVKLQGLLFSLANEQELHSAMAQSESPMVFMWEVPPKAAPAATTLKHVRPPSARAPHLPFSDVRPEVATACVVRAGCETGNAEFALQEVGSIPLWNAQPDVFRQLNIGYHAALASHRGSEARALLSACRPHRGPRQLAAFLAGAKLHLDGDPIIYSGIHQAMLDGASPSLVAEHVESVFECAQGIDPQALPSLILATADARQVPLIYALCEVFADSEFEPHLRQRQQACVHAYLKAVLKSPGASTELGALVCASASPQGVNASVVALANGNPGAAGAMLCAVLETCQGERLSVMVRALGVSAQQVLDALDASTAHGDRAWAALIRRHAVGLEAAIAIDISQAAPQARPRERELVGPADSSRQVMEWLAYRAGDPADAPSDADRALNTRARLNSALPACYLELTQFGAALARQFIEMRLQGANRRLFALEAGDRLIGVELRIDAGSAAANAYAVAVRDTNIGDDPAMKTFPDLGALERATLAAWLGPEVASRYEVESTGSDIGALLHWSQDAAAAGTRPQEFVANAPLRGNFYRQQMMSGDVKQFRRLLNQLTTSRSKGDVSLSSGLLDAIRTGYRDAMVKGHSGIAAAYFEFMSTLPPQPYDASYKAALLSGVICGPGDDSYLGGVQEALRHGHAPAAALFAGFVIGNRHTWDLAEVIAMLEAFECVDDHGNPVGMPMLHAICSGQEALESAPQLRQRQHDAVNAFAAEFLKAGAFTLVQKDRLCNARISGVSAMRAGLANQNPCAAAAIACAIFEHATPDECAELMGRSGVTADEIEWALEDIANVDPEARTWQGRLQRAKLANLAGTKEAPPAPREPQALSAEVRVHLPQDAALVHSLIPGTLIGLARADQQANDLLRNSGLRVVRADLPGEVVCATRQTLREEFEAAGLAFPLRGHRMPNDSARHPGEELYRLPTDIVVSLGTADRSVVAAARAGRVATGPNVPPAAGRVVRAPSAAWTRAWVQRAAAPGGAVGQSVSARGAGGRQFYVPGVGYPHLHIGGDFVRWSNGNGGGRYVIDHGGRVHMDTIADLLRETADPDTRAVLQAIAGESS